MIRSNKCLLLMFFLIAVSTCYSQSSSIKSYVVITYEQKFAKGFEGVERTFWIAPEDSIFNTPIKFFPLLLSGYFKNDLDSCCTGKKIDPYFSSHAKENYLDTAQEKALDILQTVIFKKRRKIQTIIKKWESGNQEQITIYATSIFGSFCSSKFHFTAQKRSGYSDLLYIPYSKIGVNNKFWDATNDKRIMSLDFSKYNFSYNILYNTFSEWKKYGK